MRAIAPADRLRAGRLAALCLVALVAVTACGGTDAGGGSGGGGGGGGAADSIIADTQTVIGTSMVSGTVDGTTITITVVDGFGEGGARLFMCSQVVKSLKQYDPSGTLTVVMVEQSGTKLISSTDC